VEDGFETDASPDFGAGFASCCAASAGNANESDNGTTKNVAATTILHSTFLRSSFMILLLPIPSYSRD
jgi:hypothetical protein